MRSRIPALVMAGLLALYLVFALYYAAVLIGTGIGVAIAIGMALIVLGAVGAWALTAEIVFAIRSERLTKRLLAEGALPPDDLPRFASGRIDPAAADLVFPEYQAAVEAQPASWRAWFRLALAYDASGDRKRARWATRTAIRLSLENPT